MAKRLPGPTRAIAAIKSSGDLVEINLRLFFAPAQNAPEIDLIGRMFRHFFRAANGQLDEFARH